jgi:hypothetical protein
MKARIVSRQFLYSLSLLYSLTISVQTTVITCSMVAFRGNQQANQIPGILGMYWYARRVPARAVATLSMLGLSLSYPSLCEGAKVLEKDAITRARAVAASSKVPFMVTATSISGQSPTTSQLQPCLILFMWKMAKRYNKA